MGVCVSKDVYSPQIDPTERLIISESCSKIYFPGEVGILGYVGDPSDLSQCRICPGDTLYDYMPQKQWGTNKYVCNVIAKGLIGPQKNFNFSADGIAINVTINNETPFPVVDDEYDVVVSANTPSAETVRVTLAQPKMGHTQELRLKSHGKVSSLVTHFATGRIVSAIKHTWNQIVVQARRYNLPNNPSEGHALFPEKGLKDSNYSPPRTLFNSYISWIYIYSFQSYNKTPSTSRRSQRCITITVYRCRKNTRRSSYWNCWNTSRSYPSRTTCNFVECNHATTCNGNR